MNMEVFVSCNCLCVGGAKLVRMLIIVGEGVTCKLYESINRRSKCGKGN